MNGEGVFLIAAMTLDVFVDVSAVADKDSVDSQIEDLHRKRSEKK